MPPADNNLLFASERFHRIFLRRDSRGNKSRYKSKEHTDKHKHNASYPWEYRVYRVNTRYRVDYRIDRQTEQNGKEYTKQSRRKSDNKRLRVEYARNILLRRADRSQHTDFLGSLEDGDIGYNSYHYR